MTVSNQEPHIIFTYSRAQALDDGVLVDVTETAKEAGFRFPVALTEAAWIDCVQWDEETRKRKPILQDENGRLWDVVWMAMFSIKLGKVTEENNLYNFYRVPAYGESRSAEEVTLKIVMGPGDEAEPVMTIMLPNED